MLVDEQHVLRQGFEVGGDLSAELAHQVAEDVDLSDVLSQEAFASEALRALRTLQVPNSVVPCHVTPEGSPVKQNVI